MASQDAYTTTLARLSLLQSNRAITSLFETPTATAQAASGGGGGGGDLNALAIPEMLAWLARAGYTPQSLAASGLRCVHVAGTKGKGSVSAFVASILAQYSSSPEHISTTGAGSRRVGLYTSPHVLSVRERIVLSGGGGGGAMISRDKFGQYINEIWERFTQAAREEAQRKGAEVPEAELAGPGTKPFYFRFLTITALHAFVREGVRDAVVECGIGGEYDATNVLPREAVTAAVVTQLGVDHVGMLGDTVEKIAWHKAGVFKGGVKAFTRRLPAGQEGVMEVLRARAREKGAELVEVGDEEVERWGGVNGAKLQGPFQKYNMALAVYAAREHLLRTGVKLEGRFGTDDWSLSDVPPWFVQGLKEAALRGRCEVFVDADGIEWHADGAHTDDSLARVGRWFADRAAEDGVRVLVFNQQERDPAPLLRALLAGTQGDRQPSFSHAVFTRNEEHKPAEGEARETCVQTTAQETMREVDPATETVVYDAVQPAVEHVRHMAAQARKDCKTCKVLVTGSFHLVGAVLKTIEQVEY
ncbi:FolC bifunctional protein [Parathielavia hyrcaniae]|uniref:Folylpolyglutamate synthase n=1 Tax=Parathielavia hyrcaniae TaxID=113614 RepID=A0AAN6PQI0_9PEZI|nr:FolC bifunctional protein [Parathielavia hyrcaniae]